MNYIHGIIFTVLATVMTSAGAGEAIRLIVPTTAGGGTDGFFRVLAKEAEPYLGSRVVVMNICSASGCAGGTIGVSKLVQSAPDGYTLAGAWMGPLTMAPHSIPVTYQPTDYVPIIRVTSAPYAVCTRADFPAASAGELIDLLRAKPNAYTYGTDGVRNGAHLAMLRIFGRLGIASATFPSRARERPCQRCWAGTLISTWVPCRPSWRTSVPVAPNASF